MQRLQRLQRLQLQRLPKKKNPKIKSAEDVLWGQCVYGARKLDGMVRHAQNIVMHIGKASNGWGWATSEQASIEQAIDEVTTTNAEGILLLTSTLFILTQTKQKDTNSYMTNLIQQLQENCKKLYGPLTKLTDMHKCTTKPEPLYKAGGVTKKVKDE
jgi:hypothetical protein